MGIQVWHPSGYIVGVVAKSALSGSRFCPHLHHRQKQGDKAAHDRSHELDGQNSQDFHLKVSGNLQEVLGCWYPVENA